MCVYTSVCCAITDTHCKGYMKLSHILIPRHARKASEASTLSSHVVGHEKQQRAARKRRHNWTYTKHFNFSLAMGFALAHLVIPGWMDALSNIFFCGWRTACLLNLAFNSTELQRWTGLSVCFLFSSLAQINRMGNPSWHCRKVTGETAPKLLV